MEASRELEIIERPSRSLALPEMDVQTAVVRFQELGQFVKTIMRAGTDYGVIPGTPKPTLLKPGAEKLCTFFGLSKEVVILEKEMDWTGKDHGGEPFFYFHYMIRLKRNNHLIAEADGSANSWEAKHRYRQGEYKCPKCEKETIRKSKADKGGGWYCWAKIGGCGAQFKSSDAAIESQDVGKKKNPDPADLVNTIQKMAYKRALVAATLVAVNASEYFTQDLEDLPNYQAPTPTPEPEPESEQPQIPGFVAAITELAGKAGKSVASILKAYQIDKLSQLRETQAVAVIDRLKKAIKDAPQAPETPQEAPTAESVWSNKAPGSPDWMLDTQKEGQPQEEPPAMAPTIPQGITPETKAKVLDAAEATGLNWSPVLYGAGEPTDHPIDQWTEDLGQKVLEWYRSK